MSDIEADGCPVWAPFVGFTGVMFALVFASECSAGLPGGAGGRVLQHRQQTCSCIFDTSITGTRTLSCLPGSVLQGKPTGKGFHWLRAVRLASVLKGSPADCCICFDRQPCSLSHRAERGDVVPQ